MDENRIETAANQMQDLSDQITANQVQTVVEKKAGPGGYVATTVIGFFVGLVVGVVVDHKLSKAKQAKAAEFQGDDAIFEKMAD